MFLSESCLFLLRAIEAISYKRLFLFSVYSSGFFLWIGGHTYLLRSLVHLLLDVL